MTTIASGRWISDPGPLANKNGTRPRAATVAVIITGRKRNLVPSRIAFAVSGAMGGSASEEFLAPAVDGEDTFVQCENCDYTANAEAVEIARGGGAIVSLSGMSATSRPRSSDCGGKSN